MKFLEVQGLDKNIYREFKLKIEDIVREAD